MTPAEILRPLLAGDERFAVTGATGWFGSTALDLLDDLLGDEAADRVIAYASQEREVRTRRGRVVAVRPLAELAAQAPGATHLLHLGFVTRDRVAGLGVPHYVVRNLAITADVLAAVAAARPRGVLYASSGAVYGARGLATDVEGDPYGTLKHLDELALRQAVADVDGTCVVARVFSVAGAGMTKPEAYALGSLIQMAQAGGPLVVRARGEVVRSYCAVDEVLALGLWALLRQQPAVFDSGGTVTEVGELAKVVAAVHGLPHSAVERTRDPAAGEDRYVGDLAQMANLARRAGLSVRDLRQLVQETSEWLAAEDRTGTSATLGSQTRPAARARTTGAHDPPKDGP